MTSSPLAGPAAAAAGAALRGPSRRVWAIARAATVVAAITATGLSQLACSSKPPPPARVSGSIEANTQLNPSVSGRPSPVLLRVYELKSATVFNSADFMALFQGDQATLAADIVSREEMMLQPGEVRPYNKALGPETRFIAVMAAYRNLESAKWRQATPVLVGREQAVLIRADELAVSVAVKAK